MRGDPHPLFLYGGVFDEKPGDRNFTSDPADDLDSYDKEKTGGNAVGVAKNNPELLAKINEVINELNESGKMDDYILKANELAASAGVAE